MRIWYDLKLYFSRWLDVLSLTYVVLLFLKMNDEMKSTIQFKFEMLREPFIYLECCLKDPLNGEKLISGIFTRLGY